MNLPRTYLLQLLILTLFTGSLLPIQKAQAAEPIDPGEPIDYSKLAFYPKRWAEQKVDTRMHAWRGKKIVLLTQADKKLDATAMTSFVQELDRGWTLYQDVVGVAPRMGRNLDGLAPIAALPRSKLTCGLGCGYIGTTGIELCKFYTEDYPAHLRDPKAISHYCFYEMGRNWYTFGAKHSAFTTGFAVYMRGVCMRQLKLSDIDIATAKTITKREQDYAKSDATFFDALTKIDYPKRKPITDKQGRHLPLSDLNVIYASIMERCEKDYGGLPFTTAFYHALHDCKEFPDGEKNKKAVIGQAVNWALCLSFAAKKNLAPMLVDRWRFPLNSSVLERFSNADFSGVTSVKDLSKTIHADLSDK